MRQGSEHYLMALILLFQRCPEFLCCVKHACLMFTQRGWPMHPHMHHLAIACCKPATGTLLTTLQCRKV